MTSTHIQFLHLRPGVAEHCVRDGLARRRPCGRERPTPGCDCARLGSVAVDDLQLTVGDVRDASLRDASLAKHPMLDLVGDSVQSETPVAVALVEEKVIGL